jgi:hypothetical protein
MTAKLSAWALSQQPRCGYVRIVDAREIDDRILRLEERPLRPGVLGFADLLIHSAKPHD